MGFVDRLSVIFTLLAVSFGQRVESSFPHLYHRDGTLLLGMEGEAVLEPERAHLNGSFTIHSLRIAESFLLLHCAVVKYIETLSYTNTRKTLKSSALLFCISPAVPTPPTSPGSIL